MTHLARVLGELAEADPPDLPDDEYAIHDLEGLQVVTTEGLDLGRLIEVLRTGANDVYVVRRRGRKQDVLIPAIADVVREVNLKSRLMVVEPLPGLLDLSRPCGPPIGGGGGRFLYLNHRW